MASHLAAPATGPIRRSSVAVTGCTSWPCASAVGTRTCRRSAVPTYSRDAVASSIDALLRLPVLSLSRRYDSFERVNCEQLPVALNLLCFACACWRAPTAVTTTQNNSDCADHPLSVKELFSTLPFNRLMLTHHTHPHSLQPAGSIYVDKNGSIAVSVKARN